MTGFDDFLARVSGIPREPALVDVVSVLTLYRRQSRRSVKPGGWSELNEIRQKRQKPRARIVVTDDRHLANELRDSGEAFPILIRGFAAYDFSPLFNLDVLYLIPDTDRFAFEIAHQIADVSPRTFAMQWPGNEREEELWN